MIAHRLSDRARGRLIVVIEEGKVVETGSHDALLARDGAYARLHRLPPKFAERAVLLGRALKASYSVIASTRSALRLRQARKATNEAIQEVP